MNQAYIESRDICSANHGGNPESIAAHSSTNKIRDWKNIISFIAVVGDATCDEVEAYLKLPHQTASARMSEMKRDGVIEPTVKRTTRSGCQAQAWRLTI